jgi:hypothetical protein
MRVFPRTLVLVSALTLGDYLLWNWSLAGGRDVLAVVSGLSFLPLVLATASLLALSVARALARTGRRLPRVAGRDAAGAREETAYVAALRAEAARSADLAAHVSPTRATTASSDKLAA